MSLVVTIRPADPTPPFEQLRSQIAAAISSGLVQAGTKLPTVRQLAGDLGVASGTVARAYKELEQAGLVVTARRAGTVVRGAGDAAPSSDGLAMLADDFVARARRLGVSNATITAAVREALQT